MCWLAWSGWLVLVLFLNCCCGTISVMLVSEREGFGGDFAGWVRMKP